MPTISQQQPLNNDYVAKNPLSPTAASEAPEQMLPTNVAAQSQVTSPQPEARSPRSSSSTSHVATTAATTVHEPTGAPTLKTTQTLELIQR